MQESTLCWGKKTQRWGYLVLLGQLCVSYYMFQHNMGVLRSFILAANTACVLGRYAANRLQRSLSLPKAPQSSSSGSLCAARMKKLESENVWKGRIDSRSRTFYLRTLSRVAQEFCSGKFTQCVKRPATPIMSPAGLSETLGMSVWVDLWCLQWPGVFVPVT